MNLSRSAGATVPAGDHKFREGSVSYGSSGGRALSGRMNVGGGGFYNGNRFTISGSVLGRLGGDRAVIDISAEHNRIDLPGQQAVDAAVYSASVKYFFSTSLLTTALMQYDEANQEVLTDPTAQLDPCAPIRCVSRADRAP